MRIKPSKTALLTATALSSVAFVLLNCSDAPLGPAPVAWVTFAVFPDPYFVPAEVTCRSDGAVFIVGRFTHDYPAVIYKLENGELIEDFTAPYESSNFSGIGFFGTVGWAVGSKRDEDVRFPYMVYYDGSDWAEVTVEPEAMADFQAVYPINETDCWLLGRSDPGDANLSVVKYTGGDWITYPSVTNVEDAGYNPNDRVLYCLREEIAGGRTTWSLAVTGDGGGMWALEEITLGDSLYEITDLSDTALYAVPGALYLTAEVTTNEHTYKGALIKRTGPPGAGMYGPVFFSNIGPFFRYINDIAFKDSGHGVLVGHETSVLYEEPDWVLEEVTPLYNFDMVAAGPNGYWAVLLGEPDNDYLLYHP